MPQKIENQKPLVNPSPSLMQRLLGSEPSDPEFDTRMSIAQTKMRQEMPNEMAHANIQPTGIFGSLKDKIVQRAIGGVPMATTSPFGNITYNKSLLAALPQNELEDTLAHELTHVRQFRDTPILKRLASSVMPESNEGLPEATRKAYSMQGWDPSYRGRSNEMEAFQTEANRQLSRGQSNPYDINLPSSRPRTVNTGPSSGTLTKIVGK